MRILFSYLGACAEMYQKDLQPLLMILFFFIADGAEHRLPVVLTVIVTLLEEPTDDDFGPEESHMLDVPSRHLCVCIKSEVGDP